MMGKYNYLPMDIFAEGLTILKVHCKIKESITKQIWRQINFCKTVLVSYLYVPKRHRLTTPKYHLNKKLLCLYVAALILILL